MLDGAAISRTPSTRLNAIVAQRIDEADGLAILRVMPIGWSLPYFRAGQFAVLGLPEDAADATRDETQRGKLIRRAYSIASSSHQGEYLEFYIVRVETGALTPRLLALAPGDPLWLSPRITGSFTLEALPAAKDVVFVATGTGLAPCLSIVRSHLTCGGGRRFAVLHGARHSWELGYRGELSTLQQLCRNFAYVPSITRPEQELAPWIGATGHLQEVWSSDPLARRWGAKPRPETSHVFLCGNPSMVTGMLALLRSEGYREQTHKAPGEVQIERYW